MYQNFNKGIKKLVTECKNTTAFKYLALVSALLLMLEPSVASAAGGTTVTVAGGAMTSFENGIQILITWMTGTVAKGVAVLAVVFMGFMALVGKLQMETAGKVILGILLIFSAAQIVGLLVT